MNDRAVVLCRTAAGMRAATWLAQRGVAVRVLCTTPSVPTDELSLVAGPKDAVASLVGPVEAVEPALLLWHDGRAVTLPQTKRGLATVVQGRTGSALGSLALGRFHRGPTAEDWVRRWLGGRVWTDAVHGWLDHRLAGPAARAPAGVARRLLGGSTEGGWWRPLWDGAERTERRVGRILDSGGEVLEAVAVEALEVEHGRLVCLQSEFGFEPLDGPLITDLPPAELMALVEEEERAFAPTPPLGDRVRVEVDGTIPADAILVLDGSRQLLRLVRSEGGVVAEAVVAPGEQLYSAAHAQLGEAIRDRLDGMVLRMGAVRHVQRQPRCITCPRPSAEAPWDRLVHRYAALGVVPVGESGWLLPLRLSDELAQLEALSRGAVVATQRASLLEDGPPAEPWSLLVQA